MGAMSAAHTTTPPQHMPSLFAAGSETPMPSWLQASTTTLAQVRAGQPQ